MRSLVPIARNGSKRAGNLPELSHR